MAKIRLYGMSGSGNCWKPAALMRLIGTDFEWIEVDLLGGETRRAPFLALNPNGRVPLLQLADGRRLAESNAMLWYLAQGSALWPDDAFDRAKVLEWMFFEQYSHEPYVATVRFWIHLLGQREQYAAKIAEASAKGRAALAVMERALASSPYLVGERLTIADLALYAYTHVADEGDYDLAPLPAIRAWLARCEAQTGFVPMRAPR